MDAHTLFTYRNLGELRRIQEIREVFPFTFVETKVMIEDCPEVCIDITALVYSLPTNKGNIQAVYINFEDMKCITISTTDGVSLYVNEKTPLERQFNLAKEAVEEKVKSKAKGYFDLRFEEMVVHN